MNQTPDDLLLAIKENPMAYAVFRGDVDGFIDAVKNGSDPGATVFVWEDEALVNCLHLAIAAKNQMMVDEVLKWVKPDGYSQLLHYVANEPQAP